MLILKNVLSKYAFVCHQFSSALQICLRNRVFNVLNPTGHVMHQQFNIQQLYVLPTLY